MDGASKFVKGDAIAGIVITIINILGGFAVGVGQRGIALGEALRRYTLLTVGDGLVTQIPGSPHLHRHGYHHYPGGVGSQYGP